jgi:hypothetical protein
MATLRSSLEGPATAVVNEVSTRCKGPVKWIKRRRYNQMTRKGLTVAGESLRPNTSLRRRKNYLDVPTECKEIVTSMRPGLSLVNRLNPMPGIHEQ